MERDSLYLAIPSNSELHDPTMRFFESCGLPIQRPSSRRYTGQIPALPGTVVVFQRSADIPAKIDEGSTDLGIVGLERYYESRADGGDSLMLVEDMGYGHCELIIAVPDSWIDVSSMADLAELSAELREKGRELRVATKYHRLVRQFFLNKGLYYFTSVEASGALEAAPIMGYADIIADIASTGVTLRENRLKVIAEGTIMRAQACLIGNRRLLKESQSKLDITRRILELIEARRRADNYYTVTANIRGESADAVAEHVKTRPEIAGIEGPTIARVYSKSPQEKDWYAVTMVVSKARLVECIEHLRQIGGSGITVASPKYVFEEECQAYRSLLAKLEGC